MGRASNIFSRCTRKGKKGRIQIDDQQKKRQKGSVYNRRSKSFRVSGILKANMGIVRNVVGDSEYKEENEKKKGSKGGKALE